MLQALAAWPQVSWDGLVACGLLPCGPPTWFENDFMSGMRFAACFAGFTMVFLQLRSVCVTGFGCLASCLLKRALWPVFCSHLVVSMSLCTPPCGLFVLQQGIPHRGRFTGKLDQKITKKIIAISNERLRRGAVVGDVVEAVVGDVVEAVVGDVVEAVDVALGAVTDVLPWFPPPGLVPKVDPCSQFISIFAAYPCFSASSVALAAGLGCLASGAGGPCVALVPST